MLKKFRVWFFDLFLFYTDKTEKEVALFFAEISSNNFTNYHRTTLEKFLQTSPVRLYLLLEKQYKGYKLSTYQRRCAYQNFEFITRDFNRFLTKFDNSLKSNFALWQQQNLHLSIADHKSEKLFYLFCISQYFHGNHAAQKVFKYRETSAFIRLLENPAEKQLIGDCNQILSLYSALYGLRFNILDLQIKLFESHVCLHLEGVDIETTNGEFCFYKKFMFLSPLIENLAISILDQPDKNIKIKTISPLTFLAAAKISLALSSHKLLVQSNIKKARYNLSLSFLKQDKFSKALKWSKDTQDPDLHKTIHQHWGNFFLKQKKFNQARKKFNIAQDPASLKICDQHELHFFLDKISGKNIKKSDVKKALLLAKTLQDSKLISSLNNILDKI